MMENHFYRAGLKYMEKSKEIYYNDPELHFMYAKYYFDCGKYNEALFYIDECLKFIAGYYPALKLKRAIEENSF